MKPRLNITIITSTQTHFNEGAYRYQQQMARQRTVDTSDQYVRGEENLRGWRPRGDSIIIEHQWQLERLTRIELVERSRHALQLREKLANLDRGKDLNRLNEDVRRDQLRRFKFGAVFLYSYYCFN